MRDSASYAAIPVMCIPEATLLRSNTALRLRRGLARRELRERLNAAVRQVRTAGARGAELPLLLCVARRLGLGGEDGAQLAAVT